MNIDATMIDTLKHIKDVNSFLIMAASELLKRAVVHDDSKLCEPELSGFASAAHELKGLTYGSPEYKSQMDEFRLTLTHHYANNSHHPQHYENGVAGMNLFDLVEMFFDWMAATRRHADGDIRKSIEINSTRFDLAPQLASIFHNTVSFCEDEALKQQQEQTL